MGKNKTKQCELCNKEMRSDNLIRHKLICKGKLNNKSSRQKNKCQFCLKVMRADNLNRHLVICKNKNNRQEFIKENTIEHVKNELIQFKQLNPSDKVFAKPHIKKLNAIVSSRTIAFKDNQCELELLDNFSKLTAVQIDILYNLYEQLAMHADESQLRIQIFSDNSGQSGKSTLGKALMAYSMEGNKAEKLISSIAQIFNWMFLYLPGLSIADCSELYDFLNELPNDEKRRFILIVDLTRSCVIPTGKIEELHERILKPSQYNDKKFRFPQPLQLVIFCNNHKSIISTLSEKRYKVHLIKSNKEQKVADISKKIEKCFNKKAYVETILMNEREVLIFCFKFSLISLDPFVPTFSTKDLRRKFEKQPQTSFLIKDKTLDVLEKQFFEFLQYKKLLFHIPAYNEEKVITQRRICNSTVDSIKETNNIICTDQVTVLQKNHKRFGSEFIKNYKVSTETKTPPDLQFVLLKQEEQTVQEHLNRLYSEHYKADTLQKTMIQPEISDYESRKQSIQIQLKQFIS